MDNAGFHKTQDVKQEIQKKNKFTPHIKELLYSDTHYNGSVKHKMLTKFGIPHYPFHPFILENLACFLTL